MDERQRKIKIQARSKAQYRQNIGALKIPIGCQKCGRPGHVEKHHTTYYDPYSIVFWCIPCHRSHHNRIRRSKSAWCR